MPASTTAAVSTTASCRSPVKIIAHRGFSSRQPESTRAAYRTAIGWAIRHDVELSVECDVHFSADDQLICLHDLTLDRTSDQTGPAFERTVEELREVDFGSWFVTDADEDQRSMVTLAELLDLVREGRERGGRIGLMIETKHRNPRGLEVEQRVATMLADAGWDGLDSPVGIISFSLPALQRAQELLPELPLTLLIQHQLGRWSAGQLPDGISAVGPDLELIKEDPDFVARVVGQGNEVQVWTANEPADIRWCAELGVTGFTTDYPDRVVETLSRSWMS